MTSPDLVVANVAVPGRDGLWTLLCAAGCVLELLPHDPAAAFPDARVIDGRGVLLMPAMTDAHTHLREPGQEWKEDIASGLAAAAGSGTVSPARTLRLIS